jgi:hypothetical protein
MRVIYTSKGVIQMLGCALSIEKYGTSFTMLIKFGASNSHSTLQFSKQVTSAHVVFLRGWYQFKSWSEHQIS